MAVVKEESPEQGETEEMIGILDFAENNLRDLEEIEIDGDEDMQAMVVDIVTEVSEMLDRLPQHPFPGE